MRTVCAGRTDSGVHATGQVVHFETASLRQENEWLRGCNANMDKDIRMRWVQPVSADFDARKSAVKRHYRYIILNTPQSSALLNESKYAYIQAAGCKSYAPSSADISRRT